MGTNMKKLLFLFLAVSAFAASSPDIGIRPMSSWFATNVAQSANADVASAAVIAARNSTNVYATGAIVQDTDSNGVPRFWRGDGTTAGGVLIGGQTTTYAPTETFARASSAIDPIDGTVASSGNKSTRTIRYLPSTAWIWEGSSGTNAMAGVTSSGAFIAYAASSGKVYRSANRGATWTLVKDYAASLSGFTMRAVDGSNGQIIFLCASPGGTPYMNVSIDDGVTWSANLLTVAESTAMSGGYQPFFSSDISVERLPGVSIGDSLIRFASYGSWIDRVTGSRYVSGRIFRSTKTVAELEAGAASLDFRKVWQVDPADYWGGAFAHDTALIAVTNTVSSATSTSVTIPDASAVTTSYLPVVKILTGLGAGQVRAISNKVSNTLNIYSAWTVTPTAGDAFTVVHLPTLNNGLHLHATALDTNRNELWVSVGDNDESHGMLVVTNWSNLTGASLASEVPEQPVNWSYTSEPYRTADQPTSLWWDSSRSIVIAPTTDWLDPVAYYITPSTRALTPTLWDFIRPATQYRNLVKGWDSAQITTNLYAFHQAVAGGIVGGLFVGDLGTLDGVTRITLSNDVHYGLSASGNYYGAMTDAASSNVVAYIPSLTSATGIGLFGAITNVLTNADFAVTTGTAPTQRPSAWTASATGVDYWVTNGPTQFASLPMLHMQYSSGSPAPSFYYAASIPSNQVFEFTYYGRNVGITNKNQNYFSADYRLYSGATPLGSGIVAGTNCNKLAFGAWQRVGCRFTNDIGADIVRVYMRSQKLQYGQTMDWCLPTLATAADSTIMWHTVPTTGTRAAETLRYTVTDFDTTTPSNARVAVLVRPYCESGDDLPRTENIMSIESAETSDRAKLQWVDDGSGNKTFRFITYNSSGTVMRTIDMGNLHHSHFDTLRVQVEWRNNSLRCTVGTPGGNQSVSCQQRWLRNWRPHTIALGEDYWDATGKRFPGWYNVESVSTTQTY